MRVWRGEFNYGLNVNETANAFGRVASWSGKGGIREADGIMWATCCLCLGPCMIEQQRRQMEIKLHRWHKERGECSGEPRPEAHAGAGGCCSVRWWPCTRPWLVAENVGALANFKDLQGLDGWPARKNWSSPNSRCDGRRAEHEEADDADEIEMQPAPAVHAMARDLDGDLERDLAEGDRPKEVDPLVGRLPAADDERIG